MKEGPMWGPDWFKYHGTSAYVAKAVAQLPKDIAFAGDPFPDTPRLNAEAVLAAMDIDEICRLYEREEALVKAVEALLEVAEYVPKSQRDPIVKAKLLLKKGT